MKDFAKIIIILCGGTWKDKVDSISLIYEKLGISGIEYNEMVDLTEGLLQFFHSFDKKYFAEKMQSSPVEMVYCTSEYCWKELKIPVCFAVSKADFNTMLGNSKNENMHAQIQGHIEKISKKSKTHDLEMTFINSLRLILGDKSLFNTILVYNL